MTTTNTKSNINDAKHWLKNHPLVKNMFKMAPEPNVDYEYPVEVKDAGEKGRGVFATRQIEKGEICCWYDGIVCSCPDFTPLAANIFAILVNGTFGYTQSLDDEKRCILAGFLQPIRKGGVAQLCNDASTTYKNRNNPLYKKRINVDHDIHYLSKEDTYVCLFRARQRIKKGQELLYSYGAEYWEIRNKREEEGETFEMMIRNIVTNITTDDMVSFFADNDFTLKGYVNRITAAKVFVLDLIAERQTAEQQPEATASPSQSN